MSSPWTFIMNNLHVISCFFCCILWTFSIFYVSLPYCFKSHPPSCTHNMKRCVVYWVNQKRPTWDYISINISSLLWEHVHFFVIKQTDQMR
jgi:hypothetical protein